MQIDLHRRQLDLVHHTAESWLLFLVSLSWCIDTKKEDRKTGQTKESLVNSWSIRHCPISCAWLHQHPTVFNSASSTHSSSAGILMSFHHSLPHFMVQGVNKFIINYLTFGYRQCFFLKNKWQLWKTSFSEIQKCQETSSRIWKSIFGKISERCTDMAFFW